MITFTDEHSRRTDVLKDGEKIGHIDAGMVVF